MPTHLTKIGATYFFRRIVPKHLRRFLLTRSGKPRVEFMETLGVKDRREAPWSRLRSRLALAGIPQAVGGIEAARPYGGGYGGMPRVLVARTPLSKAHDFQVARNLGYSPQWQISGLGLH